MKQLNNKFLLRMQQLLGEEYTSFLDSLNKPMQKAVFVNANKIDVKNFKSITDFEIEPISYEKNGFYVNEQKLGKHPLHVAGAFYSQEPSAMFTVNSLNFTGNEVVLDLCAAPGGKTIQLANKLPKGVVVSNEINFARSKILYSNVERMGLRNVIVTNNTSSQIAKAYANTFDVCLVDAPCSAEGMFRRDEKYIDGWNEHLPKMCSERQLQILEDANICLKQGGKLIYSTCTYSVEENEMVVKEFLKTHNYKLLNINADLPRGIDLQESVRMYPHKVKGEGQFVAVLIKMEENEKEVGKSLELKQSSNIKTFLNENLNIDITSYQYFDESYFILDAKLIRNGINYISVGVKLGKFSKNGFVPDHFLFTAFGKYFKRKLELDFLNLNTKRYLHGDVLNVSLDDGYGAVLINGCPVGGFKVSKGKFKNHLPKGLRI